LNQSFVVVGLISQSYPPLPPRVKGAGGDQFRRQAK
jgi:hypothetical protein